jgi:hypothetical protein
VWPPTVETEKLAAEVASGGAMALLGAVVVHGVSEPFDLRTEIVDLRRGRRPIRVVFFGHPLHDRRRQRGGDHTDQTDAADHQQDRTAGRIDDAAAANGVPGRSLEHLEEHDQPQQPQGTQE